MKKRFSLLSYITDNVLMVGSLPTPDFKDYKGVFQLWNTLKTLSAEFDESIKTFYGPVIYDLAKKIYTTSPDSPELVKLNRQFAKELKKMEAIDTENRVNEEIDRFEQFNI